ncbi:peptidyl-prolyl cis-trans isomerase [bacterium]|nr:peptidyl-prolyl cis-trans isomerase [bacterium]
MAKAKIETIQKDIKDWTELEKIKEKYKIKEIEDIEITKRTSYVKGAGKVDNIVSLAFGMKEGEISDPIKTSSGYMLLKVTSKELFKEEDYQKKRQEILNSILETRKNEILDDYLKSLKENADIKNYLTETEEEV